VVRRVFVSFSNEAQVMTPVRKPVNSEATLDWNPLYDAWRSVTPQGAEWYTHDAYAFVAAARVRERVLSDYAFAIPTPEAIQAIVAAAPRIVELGAGTGYWAKLLAAGGADIVALEAVPSGEKNHYAHGQVIGRWFPVDAGTATDLARFSDRALLLCWPPMDSMARDAIDAWRGDVLIHIGERGGCNADEAFYERLEAEFETLTEIDLPQWPGLHDYLWILRRKRGE
jgi:hypothetical protein